MKSFCLSYMTSEFYVLGAEWKGSAHITPMKITAPMNSGIQWKKSHPGQQDTGREKIDK